MIIIAQEMKAGNKDVIYLMGDKNKFVNGISQFRMYSHYIS